MTVTKSGSMLTPTGGNNSIPASEVALEVKNPPANAGDIRNLGSIPGSGRPPGGGHGNPLQYPCLENPMDRGAWRATAHGLQRVGHDRGHPQRIPSLTEPGPGRGAEEGEAVLGGSG